MCDATDQRGSPAREFTNMSDATGQQDCATGGFMKKNKHMCISCGRHMVWKHVTYVDWDKYNSSSPEVMRLQQYAESLLGVRILVCKQCDDNLQNTMTCATCSGLVHKH